MMGFAGLNPSYDNRSTHRGDRVRDCNRPPCHIGVQPLHHLAVEPDRAARGVLRLLAGAKLLEDILGLRGTTPIDPREAQIVVPALSRDP